MTELFNIFFKTVERALGAGGLFLIFSFIDLVIFAFSAIFLRFFDCNRVAIRVKFMLAVISVCIAELAFAILCKHTQGFVLLTLAIGTALFIGLTSIRANEERKKQKELVKLIDEKISENKHFPNDCGGMVKNSKADECVIKKQPRMQEICSNIYEQHSNCGGNHYREKCEIDFSHAKSILSRLDCVPLSASDRRKVKDLEHTVIQAESGEYNPQTKSKINDGLGALLKIMSKYGI